MTDTSKLEGRELADACCTAMGGWECGHGLEDPDPSIDEMLAWLTKGRSLICAFICDGAASLKRIDGITAEGATLHEALQRLVVAVAEGKR